MDHFAGLDVSVKETSVCIVDDTGKILREVKVASEPYALLQVLRNPTYRFKRIGLEAGPLSQWLFSALRSSQMLPGSAWLRFGCLRVKPLSRVGQLLRWLDRRLSQPASSSSTRTAEALECVSESRPQPKRSNRCRSAEAEASGNPPPGPCRQR